LQTVSQSKGRFCFRLVVLLEKIWKLGHCFPMVMTSICRPISQWKTGT